MDGTAKGKPVTAGMIEDESYFGSGREGIEIEDTFFCPHSNHLHLKCLQLTKRIISFKISFSDYFSFIELTQRSCFKV